VRQGVGTGNNSFTGIEAENAGIPAAAWPDVQLDAYAPGAAAILKQVGAGAQMCCGHRERGLPLGRKADPHTIDMDDFRTKVAAIMARQAVVRPLIPAFDAHSRPTLRRGARGGGREGCPASGGCGR
jgi:hypothetical protein